MMNTNQSRYNTLTPLGGIMKLWATDGETAAAPERKLELTRHIQEDLFRYIKIISMLLIDADESGASQDDLIYANSLLLSLSELGVVVSLGLED